MSASRLPFAFSILLVSALHAGEPLRVVTDNDNRPIAIEAIGWSREELAQFAKSETEMVNYLRPRLSIHVVDGKGLIHLQAVIGNYQLVDDAVRFTPQFRLRPGVVYQASFRPPARRDVDSTAHYTLEIKLPAVPPAEPTRVTAIYPSASTLPDNQLRFYLHFSAPMAAGNAYEHVKLVKANGDVVSRAFLEIGEELWDGTGQRLTLLFDPGRVKKGLSPRIQFGPVLEAGNSYRLVIDKAWRDANGQPLAASFEKAFAAGPAVESAVDFKQWRIIPPAAGTPNSLVIQFPRSLDRALLMRMITVADASGKEVAGEITLGDDERRWEFRPEQPLAAGNYTLVIDTALEDSAGNNLARPFEVDVFDRVDDKPGPELVRIPFVIAAGHQ